MRQGAVQRTMNPPLLSSFYFGSVEHYRLLANAQRIHIDTGEHYVRQSYRTRTGIVGPNGAQDLSVQVVHGHGRKMPMHEVKLSRAETWPQQHVHAIRSAYGQTPWFIHYIEDIERVLLGDHERLVDLNLATLRLALGWLGFRPEITVSEQYVEDAGAYTDLRNTLHPKRDLPSGVEAVPPYPQVFADRLGCVGRRSVIDLVCNHGPRSRELLLATT